MWTTEEIKKAVESHKIVIFVKGTRLMPMCGFSNRAIQIMNQVGTPFEVINIFDDPSIRPALIEFSGWPTTPQVFVGGKFIGGSDIALEMFESGELQKKIESAMEAE